MSPKNSCSPLSVGYHSTDPPPHSSPSTCCTYQKDKRAKPGDFTKSTAFSNVADINQTVISRVAWCVAALCVPPQDNVAQDAATSPGVRGSSLRCLEVRLAAAEGT